MAPVGRRRLSFPSSSSSSSTSSASSFLLLLLLLLASATAFLLPSSLPSSFSSSSLTTRRQQQQQQQLSRRVGTLVYAGEDNVEIGVRREGGREGGRTGFFKSEMEGKGREQWRAFGMVFLFCVDVTTTLLLLLLLVLLLPLLLGHTCRVSLHPPLPSLPPSLLPMRTVDSIASRLQTDTLFATPYLYSLTPPSLPHSLPFLLARRYPRGTPRGDQEQRNRPTASAEVSRVLVLGKEGGREGGREGGKEGRRIFC
jgi:hypothetical protein